MPEGDTIFRTARALGRALAGRPIVAFRSTYPTLTRFHDDTPLSGQTIDRVESRGKWLLMHFSGGLTLVTHMLMNGSWHIYRPGQAWQRPRGDMRIAIETRDYHAIGFRVPVAEMHTAQSLARDRRIPQPSLDVLSASFDPAEAARRLLAHGELAVADALLDQSIFAGAGNVFKSEVCFVAGVHPFTPVSSLTHAQGHELIAIARKLVAANVLEDSGDAIVTYGGRQRRTTHASDPGANLWVYGRAGQPCRRCGEPIAQRLQGPNARVTFWCPRCQPMPDRPEVDG